MKRKFGPPNRNKKLINYLLWLFLIYKRFSNIAQSPKITLWQYIYFILYYLWLLTYGYWIVHLNRNLIVSSCVTLVKSCQPNYWSKIINFDSWDTLPSYLDKWIPRVSLSQTFLCSTKFLEKTQIFMTSNKNIMKKYFMVILI